MYSRKNVKQSISPITIKPILAATPSEAKIGGRSLVGTAGSNPAEVRDVFLL
jgi:hypothetical protein